MSFRDNIPGDKDIYTHHKKKTVNEQVVTFRDELIKMDIHMINKVQLSGRILKSSHLC